MTGFSGLLGGLGLGGYNAPNPAGDYGSGFQGLGGQWIPNPYQHQQDFERQKAMAAAMQSVMNPKPRSVGNSLLKWGEIYD